MPAAPATGRAPPGGLRRELTPGKAAAVLAGVRPRDVAVKVRRQLAVQHLGDIRALDRKLTAIRAQIAISDWPMGPAYPDATPLDANSWRRGRSRPLGQVTVRRLVEVVIDRWRRCICVLYRFLPDR